MPAERRPLPAVPVDPRRRAGRGEGSAAPGSESPRSAVVAALGRGGQRRADRGRKGRGRRRGILFRREKGKKEK